MATFAAHVLCFAAVLSIASAAATSSSTIPVTTTTSAPVVTTTTTAAPVATTTTTAAPVVTTTTSAPVVTTTTAAPVVTTTTTAAPVVTTTTTAAPVVTTTTAAPVVTTTTAPPATTTSTAAPVVTTTTAAPVVTTTTAPPATTTTTAAPVATTTTPIPSSSASGPVVYDHFRSLPTPGGVTANVWWAMTESSMEVRVEANVIVVGWVGFGLFRARSGTGDTFPPGSGGSTPHGFGEQHFVAGSLTAAGGPAGSDLGRFDSVGEGTGRGPAYEAMPGSFVEADGSTIMEFSLSFSSSGDSIVPTENHRLLFAYGIGPSYATAHPLSQAHSSDPINLITDTMTPPPTAAATTTTPAPPTTTTPAPPTTTTPAPTTTTTPIPISSTTPAPVTTSTGAPVTTSTGAPVTTSTAAIVTSSSAAVTSTTAAGTASSAIQTTSSASAVSSAASSSTSAAVTSSQIVTPSQQSSTSAASSAASTSASTVAVSTSQGSTTGAMTATSAVTSSPTGAVTTQASSVASSASSPTSQQSSAASQSTSSSGGSISSTSASTPTPTTTPDLVAIIEAKAQEVCVPHSSPRCFADPTSACFSSVLTNFPRKQLSDGSLCEPKNLSHEQHTCFEADTNVKADQAFFFDQLVSCGLCVAQLYLTNPASDFGPCASPRAFPPNPRRYSRSVPASAAAFVGATQWGFLENRIAVEASSTSGSTSNYFAVGFAATDSFAGASLVVASVNPDAHLPGQDAYLLQQYDHVFGDPPTDQAAAAPLIHASQHTKTITFWEVTDEDGNYHIRFERELDAAHQRAEDIAISPVNTRIIFARGPVDSQGRPTGHASSVSSRGVLVPAPLNGAGNTLFPPTTTTAPPVTTTAPAGQSTTAGSTTEDPFDAAGRHTVTLCALVATALVAIVA